MSKKTSTAPVANKPIHSFRHRNIQAAIWLNQTDKGPMYNVTIARGYKVGEEWHESDSYGYTDLLIIAKLMYDCHSYISELRAKESAAPRRSQQDIPY
jgi:hypothetical protein